MRNGFFSASRAVQIILISVAWSRISGVSNEFSEINTSPCELYIYIYVTNTESHTCHRLRCVLSTVRYFIRDYLFTDNQNKHTLRYIVTREKSYTLCKFCKKLAGASAAHLYTRNKILQLLPIKHKHDSQSNGIRQHIRGICARIAGEIETHEGGRAERCEFTPVGVPGEHVG